MSASGISLPIGVESSGQKSLSRSCLRQWFTNRNLKHRRKNINMGKNTVDAPPTQPQDPGLAQLRVDWSNVSPLDRSERLKVLIAKGHSRRAVAKAIGRSEGSIRQHLSYSFLTDQDKLALQQRSLSSKKAFR